MSAKAEIDAGSRFAFGANWARFLALLDQRRIDEAENSLRDMLGIEHLHQRSFLDIGSGSGLFSLAARRLGARVHSFDFDPQSVACTCELKRRFFAEDGQWRIEQGSVLDSEYLRGLGVFDIVYSWGVLHHTGSMWPALEHAIGRVAPEGLLFIAIYNDQGWKSHLWWLIKAAYNKLPRPLRWLFLKTLMAGVHTIAFIKQLLRGRPMAAIRQMLRDDRGRGMSARHDAVDWVGGFPFEFARPDVLESFFAARGFVLVTSRRTSSWGCNELVLRRMPCAD